MWVKICANTTLADSQAAVAAGADAVGFVFAPSQRRVTLEQAAAICEGLPPETEKVGVFATVDPGEVKRIVAGARLTAAQLHGAFDASLVRALSDESGGQLKIVQTVAYTVDAADRVASDAGFQQAVHTALRAPGVWAVLIDAAKAGASGGLGVAFDWARVGALVRAVSEGVADPKIILAGGLRPETVEAAIAAFRPWGVDVASGVERVPGLKDVEKVAKFVSAAKAAADAAHTQK